MMIRDDDMGWDDDKMMMISGGIPSTMGYCTEAVGTKPQYKQYSGGRVAVVQEFLQ